MNSAQLVSLWFHNRSNFALTKEQAEGLYWYQCLSSKWWRYQV